MTAINDFSAIDLQVVDTLYHVTVSLKGHRGVAEASNVSAWDNSQGAWYLNRVKVEPEGKGIGSRLLRKLQETLLDHKGDVKDNFRAACGQTDGRTDRFDVLIVEPGGYGSDPKRLNKFYKRNGFVEDAAYPGALVWRRP